MSAATLYIDIRVVHAFRCRGSVYVVGFVQGKPVLWEYAE